MSKVTVKTAGGLYTQEISSGGHNWVADEPTNLGGQNRGPTPYEQMLGAIGACTGITVQMYAKRKGWPLESVDVELTHRRIHARDCEDCDSKEGFVSVIDFRVGFGGGLSQEQLERLFEIAGKCPVKKTVEGEVRFRLELA